MKYFRINTAFARDDGTAFHAAVDAIKSGEKVIVFDLLDVHGISTANAHLLQQIVEEAEDHGVVGVFDNVREVVHSLIKKLGLDAHLYIRLLRLAVHP